MMTHWLYNWNNRKIKFCSICLLEHIFKTTEISIKLGSPKRCICFLFLGPFSFPNVNQQKETQRSNKYSPHMKWIYITTVAKSLSDDFGKGIRFCYRSWATGTEKWKYYTSWLLYEQAYAHVWCIMKKKNQVKLNTIQL